MIGKPLAIHGSIVFQAIRPPAGDVDLPVQEAAELATDRLGRCDECR
jgi:hypothetical protein